MERKVKILMVCHGNICRSTMAESVFTHLINQRGLSDRFTVASAATSREEIGNPPHHGTVQKLREVGIPVVPHRAVQMTHADYENYDYLIGMDDWNIRNMQRIAGGDPEHKIYKLLEFAGSTRDIADPWYTGNFDETYEDIMEGCEALLKQLGWVISAYGHRGCRAWSGRTGWQAVPRDSRRFRKQESGKIRSPGGQAD